MTQSEQKALDNEIMCVCSGTMRAQIKRMFTLGLTVEEISRKSGALTGCGGCEWEIVDFLHQLAETKISNTSATS